MRRATVFLALFVMLGMGAFAQTSPVVRATGTTPDPATRLAPQQSLYVRVAYESAQPLRFQAAGYLQGKKHERVMMNPSPVYPAGSGEAIVWLAADAGARLDEVRVRVCDANWKQLFEVPVTVAAEWHAGVPAASTAPWAGELSAAQQRAVSQAMNTPAPATTPVQKILFMLSGAFISLGFLTVPGYPLLQLYALWKLRGPARLLSALPLAFMLPIYAFCLYALSKESNLWPITAIFASPVAFLITLGVVLVDRRKRKGQAA